MKLYEIRKEIDDLLSQVDEETGEVPEEVSTALETLQIDKMVKIGNIALKIKNLSSFSKSVADEIKNLTAKKRAAERAAEWLENYLMSNMNGEKKIEGVNYTISIRESERIEVDESLDMEEYSKKHPDLVRTKYEPNKEEAKRIYKDTGVLPEGFKIIQNKNLNIK